MRLPRHVLIHLLSCLCLLCGQLGVMTHVYEHTPAPRLVSDQITRDHGTEASCLMCVVAAGVCAIAAAGLAMRRLVPASVRARRQAAWRNARQALPRHYSARAPPIVLV